jgi:cobalt/nickel transport system ATP-binding protein
VNGKTAIDIRHLGFSYPDGTVALRDVTTVINGGDSVGIVGPNGAGKSTLLMHLNGLLRGNGEVTVNGECISSDNLKKIRSTVALVFQDPDDQLFCPTVYDDIAFGLINLRYPETEIKTRVAAALDAVGLAGFEKRSAHHLSFGEKKKVALATAIALTPAIIAFDEPTSNLDPKSRDEFIAHIKDLAVTKIIATHDLDMVLEVCRQTIVLNNGRIVATGNTEELIGDRDIMERNGLKVPLRLLLNLKSTGYSA